MKGHIIKRSENSYSVVLSLGYDGQGKRLQKWVTVRGGKREAQSGSRFERGDDHSLLCFILLGDLYGNETVGIACFAMV